MEQESSMSKWGKQDDKGERRLAIAIVVALILICGGFYVALRLSDAHRSNHVMESY